MRIKLVAGNWKMNKTFQEAELLAEEIIEAVETLDPGNVEVILCPPAVYLELVSDLADETPVEVGAQNLYEKDFGAFTGEISAPMLHSMEIQYCIIGHSERRKYFHEPDDVLSRKIDMALKYGIIPIFCCGETLPERESGQHVDVVKLQLERALFHLTGESVRQIILAYEPVWAIGTGVNATPFQAQEMHACIRDMIRQKYGEDVADHIMILYGGSCNATNASDLFAQPDVDGGLIGGASLKSAEFIEIIKAAMK